MDRDRASHSDGRTGLVEGSGASVGVLVELGDRHNSNAIGSERFVHLGNSSDPFCASMHSSAICRSA